MTLDQALAHVRSIVESVDVLFSADFEGGFSIAPADVAANVTRGRRTLASPASRSKTRPAIAAHPLFDFTLCDGASAGSPAGD